MPDSNMTASGYPSGHKNFLVRDMIFVMQDWWEAYKSGTYVHRFPSADYKRRENKPDWSDADVNRIIGAIDEEICEEIRKNSSMWSSRGYDAGTTFSDMPLIHKRAMVQMLDDAARAEDITEYEKAQQLELAENPLQTFYDESYQEYFVD